MQRRFFTDGPDWADPIIVNDLVVVIEVLPLHFLGDCFTSIGPDSTR